MTQPSDPRSRVPLTPTDIAFLRRCIDLARESLDAGDEPFGSILVDADGSVVYADRNRVSGGDHTRHPEFEIARWAAGNIEPARRGEAVVYTSGEHCPMCAAAHAWVGLGRIVYVASGRQLADWRAGWGLPDAPVAALSINEVAPGIGVTGPVPELADDVRALHAAFAGVES
ncbi:nucleoside deaminase [Gordonia westfalica]|uniref:Nucleoside deaminase n=1 Tax=Gordonia westfalica TaxID=158898 RepID=A0ABU2GRR9_9ACTN|nr:nucleoside deaminase [Gordonia westfalica]MDS1114146.1 nucleoside deaminase [Gordonia westfalica]